MKIQAITVADSLSPQGHRLWSGLLTFPKYLLAEAKTHRIVSQDSNEVEIMLDVSLNAAKELSRNSASSRAIPTNRLLKMVEENPFVPIAWQKEHKGMQGTEYWTDELLTDELKNKYLAAGESSTVKELLIYFWLAEARIATDYARAMMATGATKQIANRLLEPFLWTTVLVSATEWENFFELRCPQYEAGLETYRSRKDFMNAKWDDKESDEENKGFVKNWGDVDWLKINKGQAEIHMMALAEAIWDAQNESEPKQLQAGEWHIPFRDKINVTPELVQDLYHNIEDEEEESEFYTKTLIAISTAMAARTSYTVVGDEKEVSYETLLGIHDKMAIAKPFHASPFEHCARAMSQDEYETYFKGQGEAYSIGRHSIVINPKDKSTTGWCRNFRGFIQYRHLIESNEES